MGRKCFYRCSNAMVIILNTASLLASLELLRVWFSSSVEDAGCDKLLLAPFLAVGASLLVVSVLGIYGAGFRSTSGLRLYLAASFFVILGVSCFSAYLFVAVREGNGEGGNPLGDYSGWMQRTVHGGSWESIRSCLRESKICAKSRGSPPVDSAYYDGFIAPLKMGCCEKPKACFLKNQQADCARWDDNPKELCLACDSCKIAILSAFRMDWTFLAKMSLFLISFIAIVYFFGCCTLRYIHEDKYNYFGPPA